MTRMIHRCLMRARAAFLLLLCAGAAQAQDSEVFSLLGANWAGDANTQGGLDAGLPGDGDCLVASADGALGFPASASLKVTLLHDYSRNDAITLSITYRANAQQAAVGTVLWDGQPIATCHAKQPAEALLVKQLDVRSSDFDFSPGSHTVTIQAANDAANPEDFFEIDALKLAPVGPYHGAAARPPADWLIVHGDGETTPVTENLAKLVGEVTSLSQGAVAQVAASQLTAEQKAANNLILVGTYANHALARELLDAHTLGNPFAADPQFVNDQGYVTAVYPGAADANRKVIAAIGWNPLGAVYAISHLRTHLQASAGDLYLDAEGSPRAFKTIEETHKPDLDERAVYYNIAYGISYGPLTPDNWTDAQWEYWVDQNVCAQFTHIYFFLWGSIELYFPKSPLNNTAKNIRVHQSLITMIDYAHRRGLKVVYQFSPTLVPADIFNANKTRLPNLPGVYPTGNDSLVCQAEKGRLTFGQYAWDGALELMKDAYGNEIQMFKKADGFNLWFYDPGGCFCDATRYDCKGHQVERLMEQVDVFSKIVKQHNPAAQFTVVTWPIWILESAAYYNMPYRAPLLQALKTYFGAAAGQVTILDSNKQSDTLLIDARPLGFRLNGFVYESNLETGYPFLIPLLNYMRGEAQRSKALQVDALHLMRIEEGSKFPNTYFGAELFWNRDLSRDELVGRWARWVANANADSATKLSQAMLLLDSFMNTGSGAQDHEAKGAQIQTLVESALQGLPAARQQEFEWLLTTARAMALLGKAVEHADQTAALGQQFRTLLAASPAFKTSAATFATNFSKYVDWIRTGWNQSSF